MNIAAAALCVAAGVALASGQARLSAGAIVLVGATLVGLGAWRWSLYALIVYLPFSGIPIIASYPHTHIAVLLKDFLFVLPAYLGFVASATAQRSRILFEGAPLGLMGLLTVLVLGEALNPALPNRLIGLIGVKVWLLYVPLYFLGFHFVRNREDLGRLLKVISLAAIIPLCLGILEAVLISAGHSSTVYAWYGSAASAVTQDFATFNYSGGATLHRVSSTFSFTTQYYAFAVSMVALSYAWWRGFLAGGRHAWVGRLAWLLSIAAAMLSGARGAFIFVPALVLVMILLDRPLKSGAITRLAGPIVAMVAVVATIGTTALALLGSTYRTGVGELNDVFVTGFRHALETTWVGLGTGADTNATRYAYSTHSLFQGVGGTWYESWWVKVVLELGLPGLVLVVLLFARFLTAGWRTHRRMSDPRLRSVSAALLAFLIWNLVYGLKGQYLDLDPIDVYFWLLLGVMARLALLADRAEIRD